jgi:predicted ATPase/DNA-binding CsgD family transcriptional regulator/Tfp pilus assembly protein PilF
MTTDILLSAGNIPAEPNSFVGRERDLAELGMLLTDVRALTLCGPGGIGKTRLALRLAGELAGDFPDGTWLAELADLRDPDLVPRRVAATLGILEEPDRSLTETLNDALRSRRLLLILDTCEHLVDASAALVQQLLAGCRWLRVVATSREPLRVRGETVWRVPPLELPVTLDQVPAGELAEHEAVRLFADRAAAVRPGFTLGQDNAQAVARLCRMLDGIPLAIELAAARIRALSVEQVATRLRDRFGLLASGDRTAPVRQQTLRAAVDWSFELLTEPEQALLRRLSVFSGWNLEMAEQVCADEQIPADDVLDLLAALIDKSLVSLDGELAGAVRYRLLDTIGEYAATRLAASGEQAAIRAAHRDYLLRLAEGVVARGFLRGDPPWPERVQMYLRIDVERPNFRAALAECLELNDAERGLRLCSALRSAWVAYGDVTEGVGWFDRFLALDANVSQPVRARALVHRSELAFEQQDLDVAARCAQAGLDLLGSPGEPGGAGGLRILGLVSLHRGLPDDALASVDAAAQAARAAGDPWEEGLAQSSRAGILARLGQLAEAEQAYELALHILRDNNGWGVAQALYGYGTLARQRGDNEAAVARFREALKLYREIDARPDIARCLAGIGWVAMAQLDLELAATSLAESIQLSLATGQRLAIARGVDSFAALAVLEDDLARAVKLAGAASALRSAGHGLSGAARARLDGLIQTARQALGAAETEALVAEGSELSAHEAVAYALGLRDGDDETEPALAQAPPDGPPRVSSPAGRPADSSPADSSPASRTTNGTSGSVSRGRAAPLPGLVSASGGLTARELEIARLIARGLSNRGIADELTISPATAARHVANIFGKLGFSSRAQVAAWAVEREPRPRR